MEQALYSTAVMVTGGRNGHVKSTDGILELDVRIPKEMGGPGGATNPEQLFAAGYAACFDSALNLMIRNAKVETGTSSVTAKVSIGKQGVGFALFVEMSVNIPGVEIEKAKELVERAHEVCPYSNATRGNIDVAFHVTAEGE
ncbi:organic hydroperoxide resistance protein [Chitinophaga sancti]|uniref:organic hydroperoxide resistance protein n=1 Tax=Chitinophaga sancti TaxID=1004 RepID=UPI002A75BE17|nr:organic hydroperoxide resistance protein [Chitinophaga sancti]WPQ65830.1 organic hydroperoxide resistance protein [Chitinophaga sancti]